MDIAQPYIVKGCQLVIDRWNRLKEVQRLFYRHIQHVGDRLALIMNFQRLAVIAAPLADFAGHVDIGQKLHLNLDNAAALAGFAAPTLRSEEHTSELQSRFEL